ncbi:unnamed protein product [Vitrella brassicaformis CCMP3155]|uniref:DEP domain-containing protein n=2 Tax=Vitrella brassicaformis TaxID=1169539 RepID=A0A0G4GNV1_VITBC|nr:unnamed protein product [Vitrella brassicaformis CCMP3155]|mmetsp:Transcript_50671/g.127095  ORF Transcript_50671/g.127095 Transcript_50671/m.127095 type:complete len:494 (+) Transcript_50671:41-1522(+)|eukprot:CEM31849.1 unnamed protein product [Vitrella brassicaformis CCMP3155]
MGAIVIFSLKACPHCKRVKGLFEEKGWDFIEISLTDYPEKRNDMLQLTDRLTVPQVFFNSKHLGGAADIDELDRSGALDTLYTAMLAEEAPSDERLQRPAYRPKDEAPPPALEQDKFFIGEREYTYTELMDIFLKEVDIKDRMYHLKTYKNCFVGQDFVDYLLRRFQLRLREEAIQVGQQLFLSCFFSHVCKDHHFKDDYLFYRFHLHEDPQLLNNLKRWDEPTARPAMQVIKGCKAALSSLQSKYLDNEGMLDLAQLTSDPAFREFQNLTCEIQKVPFGKLSRDEKLAFGINLYNMMVIHAFAQVGVPMSGFARMSFFDNPAYEIGGHRFTMSELENGILRANRKAPSHLNKHFKPNDPRGNWALPEVDCRIHFALNCGAKSCPPVKNFTAEAIDEELRIAAQAFCEMDENVSVDRAAKTIFLSKIFDWYAADFGANTKEVLTKAADWCRGDKKAAVEGLLATGGYRVRYTKYDWSNNAKNAKKYEGGGIIG